MQLRRLRRSARLQPTRTLPYALLCPLCPQTTVKDALKKLQETLEDDKKVEDLEDVRLCMVPWQMPLITKMDGSLGTLKKCKHLRLSSNQLDRIGSLAGMGELAAAPLIPMCLIAQAHGKMRPRSLTRSSFPASRILRCMVMFASQSRWRSFLSRETS